MTLDALARKYGSDKHSHGFCPFYERLFGPVRADVEAILEIGVMNGASIRMWLDYFPNATVYGMDNCMYVNRAVWPRDDRFTFVLAEPDGPTAGELQRLVSAVGRFDIVLDDASHTMHYQKLYMQELLPHTAMFYVVEDLDTSFKQALVVRAGQKEMTYATGADTEKTTYDVLAGMENVHFFDRDDDHRHMTAVIERTDDAENR